VYVFPGVWQRNCPILVHVLILSVDTSSPSGSVAIARDSHLLGVISTTTDEPFSSRIFRQLDYLLTEAQLRLEAFDLFAVNAGPGSFTGLRVGLTAAKAWSEAFMKPIVAVSGLEAVALQVRAPASRIVSVIDARRGEVYAASYGSDSTASRPALPQESGSESAVMAPAEFLSWLRELGDLESTILATTSTEWLASTIGAKQPSVCGFTICEVSAVLAPAMARLAFAKAQRGEYVDALKLDANYVRRSDAELNWKAK
jgi:tRNA threonylcarbamoyladenosine biosynthesis protein TsaB